MPVGYLASYAYFKTVDMRQFKNRIYNEPLFADSGAFSAKSKGHVIAIENYARWLWKYQDSWNIYVNLDVIGDSNASAKNLETLHGYGLKPAPVVHYGDSPELLKKIIDGGATYVAFGGMAVRQHATESMKWIESMFRVTPESVDIHGFGFTRMEGMMEFPWRSVDSSSWLAGARYNAARLFSNGTLRTINLKSAKARQENAHLFEEHNVDVERFVTGKWHYKDMFTLGAVATYRMSEHWATKAKMNGWKEPRLYLAGAGDTLIHAARSIRAYQKNREAPTKRKG